jgi:hypothetical protein
VSSAEDTDAAPTPAAAPTPGTEERRRGRVGRVVSGTKALFRLVYRDPLHVSERITLYTVDRLADEAREWSESIRSARPDTPLAELAEEQRAQTAQIARVDGAISGTPFMLALLPGYLTYLWQEMRMTLRMAALYDRDPRALRTAAEMLALRGVHPTVDRAEEELIAARDTPLPERPENRRPIRNWIRSGYSLLVFGGFMSPSKKKPRRGKRELARDGFFLLAGGVIWVLTWVLPFTFMIVMAWGCESHARQLGRRALIYYDGEEASMAAAIAAAGRRHDRGHGKREILRTAALFVSVAVPIVFVAYVAEVRNTAGLTWLSGLAALVALSLVVATVMLAARR